MLQDWRARERSKGSYIGEWFMDVYPIWSAALLT